MKEDRDYDIKDIEVDPRLKVIRKEMIVSFFLLIAFMFSVAGSAYYLWDGGDVGDYQAILGLPIYFAIPTILSFAWFALIILVIRFYFKDINMSPYIDREVKK